MITETEYNALERSKEKALERSRENTRRIRKQSVINGTDKMTMDEINAMIKER